MTACPSWIEDLPRIAQAYIDDDFTIAFAKRFGVLAQRIAARLEELTDPATCTANEVALHMIIESAAEGLLDTDWFEARPHRAGDDDFYRVMDCLFYDLEVLHPYDLALTASRTRRPTSTKASVS